MHTVLREENMKMGRSTYSTLTPAFVLLLVALLSFAPSALAAQQAQAATQPSAPAQKAFDTPQQAADALIKAAGDFDVPELLAILGPEGHDVVASPDTVQDKNNAMAFAKEAAAKNSIQLAKSNPNRATLIVGDEEWPLPIPLVKKNGKWYFDSKAGRQEILFRRIGENELDAITVCRGYVEAQKEYALEPHDGINQYAQKIISTPGKQDGLYWKNPDGTSGGPIGEEVAKAIEEGYNYNNVKQGGFHGYYFKILKGQGPAAPIGKIDYVIEGVMIGGFALVAVPAEYRVTGVKTFIVSNDGIVYQKDLGPDSLKIAKEMELYNPDKTWQPTDDAWPENVTKATP
jgi:Protein of unknown function (DUF2950)